MSMAYRDKLLTLRKSGNALRSCQHCVTWHWLIDWSGTVSGSLPEEESLRWALPTGDLVGSAGEIPYNKLSPLFGLSATRSLKLGLLASLCDIMLRHVCQSVCLPVRQSHETIGEPIKPILLTYTHMFQPGFRSDRNNGYFERKLTSVSKRISCATWEVFIRVKVIWNSVLKN